MRIVRTAKRELDLKNSPCSYIRVFWVSGALLSSRHDGPYLGTPNKRGCLLIRSSKGTVVLTSDHLGLSRAWGFGVV